MGEGLGYGRSEWPLYFKWLKNIKWIFHDIEQCTEFKYPSPQVTFYWNSHSHLFAYFL